ncbi:FTR1 family iron permease [Polycladidibacter stylochi]|uniref:FTR1 family iron permease n=1 Tax=Polycladidibacter stylochi TaxID=1807766 RepID=UPI00082CF397|nr:FTR1 family protein [Pseudovibrio stylochi]
MIKKIRNLILHAVIALFFSSCFAQAAPHTATDYKDMISRIVKLEQKAGASYAVGDAVAAKKSLQSAYFEIFENLEGPIRVNVSAAKSYELESEFAAIRALIKQGAPVSQVQQRLQAHSEDIQAVLPLLAQTGHVIVAEDATQTRSKPNEPIEPRWNEVVTALSEQLHQASVAYQNGDAEKAAALIKSAKFDNYKNALLETAVRRHVSQRVDGEIQSEMDRIRQLVLDGQPSRLVFGSTAVLIDRLHSLLPGLPLLEGMQPAVQQETTVADNKDWAKVKRSVIAEINAAKKLYLRGQKDEAVNSVQDAYFDVFEASGMEKLLATRDMDLMVQVEGHFSKIISLMKAGADASRLDQQLSIMISDLDRASSLLGGSSQTPWDLLVFSLMIIVREGFEAILIVTAMMAYLIKTGHKDKLSVIYNSVAVALGCSFVTAIALEWVFDMSGASRELIEGFTMLVATVVLFSMSYWLIPKASKQKWNQFIKQSVGSSLSSGSVKALWFTCFLAVYREGAETVLFYQALYADAIGRAANLYISAGFASGCCLLVVLYLVLKLGAMRLAIRPFFLVTGGLLYYMAFVFAGKGVMELVEGKMFVPSLIEGAPQITWLGIYPYWETMVPQAFLVLAALIAAFTLTRRSLQNSQNESGMNSGLT